MKILLDECLPIRLQSQLPGHDVFSVAYLNWKGIGNGRLLTLAKSHGFEVVLTSGQAVESQQNLTQLPLSIVILHPA